MSSFKKMFCLLACQSVTPSICQSPTSCTW